MVKKEIKKQEGNVSLMQRSPFRDLLSFRDTVDDWLNEVLSSRPLSAPSVEVDWDPQVDIKDAEKEVIFSASLPGVNKDDVSVELTDDTLTIRGERKEELEEMKKGYVRQEQFYGNFYRSFLLPQNVNAGQAKAEFNNGILEIKLPKTGELPSKARKIPIEEHK